MCELKKNLQHLVKLKYTWEWIQLNFEDARLSWIRDITERAESVVFPELLHLKRFGLNLFRNKGHTLKFGN
jgi:hypothetical protein